MKFRTIAALMPLALFAAGASPASATDSRLVSRLFNAEEVVVVEGRAGVQATVMFGEDEHIENVAIGDSNSWQVTPNKRGTILFVKPLSQRARTNLTVVTDRRTYLFDLVAGGSRPPLYVLRFTYPAEPEAKTAERTAAISGAGMTAEEAQAVAVPPQEPAPVDPALMNFAWRTKGSAKVLPARVYDDGTATYLAWDEKSQIPAILTRNDKGEEGALNYAVRDGVIVLDSVPRLIILRAGRDSATIEYQGTARGNATPAANGAAAIALSDQGK